MNTFKPSAPPGFALGIAGGISLSAWGAFAWRSQDGSASLTWMLASMAVAWAGLGWAMAHVSWHDSRPILAFGIGFRMVALVAQPVMEDDHYRFLWDGYRFAATGSPYAEAPLERFADPDVPTDFHPILDRINHPDVPTIYGPLTEWAFRACHAVAPARLWPWKIALFGADLAVLLLLWSELKIRGRLLLAWCPLAIFETGFNAHPDVLAVAFVVAAWWLRGRNRVVASGIAIGLAVTAKIFALLLVPFILWRLGWRAWLAALMTVVALYAPFWLRGSAADFAGVRAMAAEWEFNSSVYALFASATPPAMARALCGLIFVGVWLLVFRRWSRTARESLPPGEWIYGAFLLLSAVANPWYALWLWPFIAVRPSATGIVALAAASLAYVTGLNLGDTALGNFGHPWWLRPVEFGFIGIAAIYDWRKSKTRSRGA